MVAGVIAILQIIARLPADLVGLLVLSLRPRRSIEAENLFHAMYLTVLMKVSPRQAQTRYANG
jgi:hypothetical protein